VPPLPVNPGGPARILTVARASEQKDPFKFIEIITALNREHERVEATWVGDGELLNEARRRAANSGVKGISFIGGRSDIADLLRNSDIAMLTSRWEGMPLFLLQAMSLGRALVASNVGGCSEIVRDGINGVLFEPHHSAEEVADRIASMLEPTILADRGGRSRAAFEDRRTIRDQVDEIVQIYQRIS
jgi:glycosyltransferase involved in cell wall biosynthesis